MNLPSLSLGRALKSNETNYVPVDIDSGLSMERLGEMLRNQQEDKSGNRPLILASEIAGTSNETHVSSHKMAGDIALLFFETKILKQRVTELEIANG